MSPRCNWLHLCPYTALMDGLDNELEQLRQAHAASRPSARLAAIRQRLAQSASDPAASRLITLLSAIEAPRCST